MIEITKKSRKMGTLKIPHSPAVVGAEVARDDQIK